MFRTDPETLQKNSLALLFGLAVLIGFFFEYRSHLHIQELIDANPVRVPATVLFYDEHQWNVREPAIVLAYHYDSRHRRAELQSLSPYLEPGSYVCLEIAGTHPQHVRECDTRGDGAYLLGLVWFVAGMLSFGAAIWLFIVCGMIKQRRLRPRRGQPGWRATSYEELTLLGRDNSRREIR
jgi:hypothetical protein